MTFIGLLAVFLMNTVRLGDSYLSCRLLSSSTCERGEEGSTASKSKFWIGWGTFAGWPLSALHCRVGDFPSNSNLPMSLRLRRSIEAMSLLASLVPGTWRICEDTPLKSSLLRTSSGLRNLSSSNSSCIYSWKPSKFYVSVAVWFLSSTSALGVQGKLW